MPNKIHGVKIRGDRIASPGFDELILDLRCRSLEGKNLPVQSQRSLYCLHPEVILSVGCYA